MRWRKERDVGEVAMGASAKTKPRRELARLVSISLVALLRPQSLLPSRSLRPERLTGILQNKRITLPLLAYKVDRRREARHLLLAQGVPVRNERGRRPGPERDLQLDGELFCRRVVREEALEKAGGGLEGGEGGGEEGGHRCRAGS